MDAGLGDIPTDPLQFEEAIRALLDRVPMTRELYDQLLEAERNFAFTVSNVAQADVVADVLDGIERAVRDGTTLDDFKDDIGGRLEESWGGEIPGRIETIFRTNVMTAYGQGRYEQHTDDAVIAARPYWRLDGVLDKDTSEICEPLLKAKIVLPADHPWWNGHYPPLHYNCRDLITALTKEQAQDEGITRSPPDIKALPGFGDAPSGAGSDWEPDPRAEYQAPLAGALEDKLDEEAA